jgi:hypothetical protein
MVYISIVVGISTQQAQFTKTNNVHVVKKKPKSF